MRRASRVLVLPLSLLATIPVRAETPDDRTPTATTEKAGTAEAGADGDAKARAGVLFDEAVELASAGNYPDACAKLEASLKLYDAVGTSFHLAGCWQKVGRTASAYALFEKVAHKTFKLGQTERAEAARARMVALAPNLSRLRIDVDLKERPRLLEIKSNGVLVPESDWGESLPVDRGEYEITVTAEKKQPWARRVDVSDAGVTYALLVPELTSVPTPVVVPPPKPASTKPTQKPAEEGSSRKVLAYTMTGVGVAGLAVGGWFAWQYRDKNDQAKQICPASVQCTPSEVSEHAVLVDDAKQARTWAFVSAGVGGHALASAGYFFFSGPSKSSGDSAIWAEPMVTDLGSVGAALRGRF